MCFSDARPTFKGLSAGFKSTCCIFTDISTYLKMIIVIDTYLLVCRESCSTDYNPQTGVQVSLILK